MLTCVSPAMNLQVFRPGKDFSTLRPGTGKGLLSCVNSNVINQLVLGFEWFSVATAVQPETGVIVYLRSSHMIYCDVSYDFDHRGKHSIARSLCCSCLWIFLIDPKTGQILLQSCCCPSRCDSCRSRQLPSRGCWWGMNSVKSLMMIMMVWHVSSSCCQSSSNSWHVSEQVMMSRMSVDAWCRDSCMVSCYSMMSSQTGRILKMRRRVMRVQRIPRMMMMESNIWRLEGRCRLEGSISMMRMLFCRRSQLMKTWCCLRLMHFFR